MTNYHKKHVTAYVTHFCTRNCGLHLTEEINIAVDDGPLLLAPTVLDVNDAIQ